MNEEIIKYLTDGLKDFDPVVIDYNKDKVIGFVNDKVGDLVLYIKKDEIVMTFGYQNAHFSIEDKSDALIHTKKYLTGELCSVEFFDGNNSLFGGSRESESVKFDTIDGILNCYSAGNEEVKNNIREFLKKKDYNVRAVNFDGSINTIVYISYSGGEFTVTKVR